MPMLLRPRCCEAHHELTRFSHRPLPSCAYLRRHRSLASLTLDVPASAADAVASPAEEPAPVIDGLVDTREDWLDGFLDTLPSPAERAVAFKPSIEAATLQMMARDLMMNPESRFQHMADKIVKEIHLTNKYRVRPFVGGTQQVFPSFTGFARASATPRTDSHRHVQVCKGGSGRKELVKMDQGVRSSSSAGLSCLESDALWRS